MSFYRERIVKRPRKEFVCAFCQEPITGEHLYVSGKTDGYDFCTCRAHVACYCEASAMCAACQYGPCDGDSAECFREMKREEEAGK